MEFCDARKAADARISAEFLKFLQLRREDELPDVPPGASSIVIR